MKNLIFVLLMNVMGAAFAAPPALCVNSWCLSEQAFGVLYQQAEARQPGLDKTGFRHELVNRHLVAAHARAQKTALLNDRHDVGFSQATELEQMRYAVYHGAYQAAFVAYARQQLDDDGLKAYLTSPIHLQGVDIEAALQLKNRQRLAMTDSQHDAAKTITVVSYRFPQAGQQSVTLATLYDQQNVQGRQAMHAPDRMAFLQKALQNHLAEAYFFWWLETQGALSVTDRDSIDQALADQQVHDAWLKHEGLLDVMHDDGNTPALQAAMQRVTGKLIVAWYARHKKDIQVVDSVRAFHVACATQEDCLNAKAALEAGEAADQVAARFADKQHHQAVELGVFSRQQHRLEWLPGLAMMQQPGRFSVPVRAPDGHWEVVWVEDRRAGVLPVTDVTVQHQARRALAQQQLLDDYHQLLGKLRQQAKVVLP